MSRRPSYQIQIGSGALVPVATAGLRPMSIRCGNAEPDELALSRRATNASLWPAAIDEVVKLYRLEAYDTPKLIFSGTLHRIETVGAGEQLLRIRGPLQTMDEFRLVRRSLYSYTPASSVLTAPADEETTHVQLNVGTMRGSRSRSASLTDVLNYGSWKANSAGAPFQIGAIDLGPINPKPWGAWAKDFSVLKAAKTVVEAVTDGWLAVDYTVYPPRLVAGRYREQTALTYTPGTPPLMDYRIAARPDMHVAGLVVIRDYDHSGGEVTSRGGEEGSPSAPIYQEIRKPSGVRLSARRVMQVDVGGGSALIHGESDTWAQKLLEDAQQPRNDGSVVLLGSTNLPRPGNVISITGVRLNVQTTLWDLSSDRCELQCGPPRRLGVDDFETLTASQRRALYRDLPGAALATPPSGS